MISTVFEILKYTDKAENTFYKNKNQIQGIPFFLISSFLQLRVSISNVYQWYVNFKVHIYRVPQKKQGL